MDKKKRRQTLKIGKQIIYSPRAYHSLIDKMIRHGESASPRGVRTLELVNASLVLRDPTDRVVPDRGRRANVAFGIAEWYSLMFGIDSIAFFSRFIENYADYSTDGDVLDGAYGTRVNYSIVTPHGLSTRQVSQVDAIVDKLRVDKDSRQAVISIYSSDDLTLGTGGKNTPCTLTLQFLVRNDELHLIVNMRSSDVFKGLTYDVMVFTFLQEYVARRLDLPLGKYIHNAASLHMYDADFKLVERLTRQRWPQTMDPMPRIERDSLTCWHQLIGDGEGFDKPNEEWFETVTAWQALESTRYLADLSNVMKSFVERKRNAEAAERAYMMVNDQTLRYVLRPWLVRAGILGER